MKVGSLRTHAWALGLLLAGGGGCSPLIVGSDPQAFDGVVPVPTDAGMRPAERDAGSGTEGGHDSGPPVTVSLPSCSGYDISLDSPTMNDGEWTPFVLPLVPYQLDAQQYGTVNGIVTLILAAGTSCASVGLDNVRDAAGTAIAQTDPLGRPQAECAVPQVGVLGGVAPASTSSPIAWYYVTPVTRGSTAPRPSLGHIGSPPAGSVERVRLGRTIFGDCTAPPVTVRAPAAWIGAYCQTSFPAQLVEGATYNIVEGNADMCGGLACFVYQHQVGMPTVHSCTCRCSDVAGTLDPNCPCPSNFACVPGLLTGPEALRGGYCVPQAFVPVDGGVVISP